MSLDLHNRIVLAAAEAMGSNHLWQKEAVWEPKTIVECGWCHMLFAADQKFNCVEFGYLYDSEGGIGHRAKRWLLTSCKCEGLIGFCINLVFEFAEIRGAVFDIEGTRETTVNLPSDWRLLNMTPSDYRQVRRRIRARARYHGVPISAMGEGRMNLARRRGRQPPRPVAIPNPDMDEQAVRGRA
ncbi:hypothetical protein GGTG_04457 [Gaeumannomyces tritici R3-111a-1]|uniref:Uncharacterized protein n=1 Tax=Gaeumannomyces tritici (strain R3-111a-1) TaxID=644352 RepID=J3NT59_GAET3|nr:hypothetical protein GGTG_04457 [Gaeumannomyces tritici R3-111a-1]EJT79373.1 hypothetical protein GGTG_04457 [Gaeumannomyces tritici R3-111a-1]